MAGVLDSFAPAGMLRQALKEAAIAGGVTLALAVPLVGFHTVQRGSELVVATRFAEVAVAVVLVFLGRFALVAAAEGSALWPLVLGLGVAAIGWLVDLGSEFLSVAAIAGGLIVALRAVMVRFRPRRGQGRESAMDRTARAVQSLTRWIAPAVIVLALLLPFLPFAGRRLLDLAILVITYMMLGWGLNIVVGLAGLLDLGYVAFYAVGAYSYALLAHDLGLGFWACLPFAGLFAGCFGMLLGFPVLRLRGDYLAIVTLGFGEMIRIILLNWVSFTNGPDGISGIPRPDFFGLSFARFSADGSPLFHEAFGIAYSPLNRIIFLYYVILALALLTNLFTLRIRKLPVGRAWEALREDEIACRSLGINPTNTKLTAFAIGAMFGGFAGAFFATRQGFISPESFTFIESAIIVAIVVLGGMGSQIGVALAAVLLIGLPEWFRDLQEYRMLAFGAGMVLIMMWRPRGLLAHRVPTLLLSKIRG